MKIEYDVARDLMYIWFGVPGEKSARTETIVSGMHADFDRQGRLIGIEILDASKVLRERVQFEVALTPVSATAPA
ncbi:MAG: DUF2283 domain-containing protein [Chloroflexi bacterium]|nr:DUF2283 domain-containing protein [Chloroflexota bacterium]